LNPDRRLGATWESFIHHDFFAPIDFEALERKQIEPVFIPSADKTNFDATYDLEELLLEEAPLEARARRQKPRERLKDDATDKEIREDELYRMIEKDFQPFDYTHAAYKKYDGPMSPLGQTTDEFARRITGQADATSNPQRADPGPPSQPQAITTDAALPASEAANGSYQSSAAHVPTSASQKSQDGSPKSSKSRPASAHQKRHGGSRPPPLPPYPNSYTNSVANGSARMGRTGGSNGIMVESPTGGVQVTLDGAGSWSELARQDATLPTDAAGVPNDGRKPEGSGGVFGFLNRKKGRAHSPKPKERGVLGKEGARVVIG